MYVFKHQKWNFVTLTTFCMADKKRDTNQIKNCVKIRASYVRPPFITMLMVLFCIYTCQGHGLKVYVLFTNNAHENYGQARTIGSVWYIHQYWRPVLVLVQQITYYVWVINRQPSLPTLTVYFTPLILVVHCNVIGLADDKLNTYRVVIELKIFFE